MSDGEQELNNVINWVRRLTTAGLSHGEVARGDRPQEPTQETWDLVELSTLLLKTENPYLVVAAIGALADLAGTLILLVCGSDAAKATEMIASMVVAP